MLKNIWLWYLLLSCLQKTALHFVSFLTDVTVSFFMPSSIFLCSAQDLKTLLQSANEEQQTERLSKQRPLSHNQLQPSPLLHQQLQQQGSNCYLKASGNSGDAGLLPSGLGTPSSLHVSPTPFTNQVSRISCHYRRLKISQAPLIVTMDSYQ